MSLIVKISGCGHLPLEDVPNLGGERGGGEGLGDHVHRRLKPPFSENGFARVTTREQYPHPRVAGDGRLGELRAVQ